jgi:hypothetical protein
VTGLQAWTDETAVQRHAVVSVNLDTTHGDNHSVIIVPGTRTALMDPPALDFVDHELVIREARRRQRRRWFAIAAVVVTISCLAVAIINLTGGRSDTKTPVARSVSPEKVAPAGRATSRAGIRGSLVACGPGPLPAVALHRRNGSVVATAVWHAVASSRTSDASRQTLHFSFSVPRGYYYLTMDNEYQMPPQARQISLEAGQTFMTHIVACTR